MTLLSELALVPDPIAVGRGWSVLPVPAGGWLCRGPGAADPGAAEPGAAEPGAADRAAPAGLVAPEPGRYTLLVQAQRLDRAALAAVDRALAVVPHRGTVRLGVPLVGTAAGQRLADRHRLDLLAPAGHLLHTPEGLLVVSGFHPDRPDGFWRWRRFRPGLPVEPAGAVHPSPPWEVALDQDIPGWPGWPALAVRRVPAGLVVGLAGALDPAFLRLAVQLRPDPDCVSVLVRAGSGDPAVLSMLDALLSRPVRGALGPVRLVWPYGAAGRSAAAVQHLADRHGVSVIAPDSGLQPDDAGGLLAGDGQTAGRWLRFTRGAPATPLGPAYPPAPAAPAYPPAPDVEVPAGPAHRIGPAPLPRPAAPTPPATAAASGPTGEPHPARAALPTGAPVLRGAPGPTGEPRLTQVPPPAGPPVLRGVPDPTPVPGTAGEAPGATDLPGHDAGAPGGQPGGPGWSAADLLAESGPADATRSAAGHPAEAADAAAPLAPPPWQDTGAADDRIPWPGHAPAPVAPWAAGPQAAPGAATGGVPAVAGWPGAGHRATAAEHQQCRARMGATHDGHLVAVSRVLAQRPALRGAQPAQDVIAGLTTMRALVAGDLPDLNAALRTGDPAGIGAVVSCVASGLRLLPTYRGPVARPAVLGGHLAAYQPGRLLIEPAFLLATTRVAPSAGDSLYLIWSETGKRTAALLPGEPDRGELVTFPAGSRFTVLAVREPGDGVPAVVYLRERPAAPAAAGDAEPALDAADLRILNRLQTAGVVDARGRSAPFDFPVGLDHRGRPFLPG
jgi:hypothetical protein